MRNLAVLFLAATFALAACGRAAPTAMSPELPTATHVPPAVPTPARTSVDLTPVQQVTVKQLASNLGLSERDVQVIRSSAVEWPDSCLGVALEGILCAQVVTAGYLIVLEAGGRQYEYHTNQDASHSMPATLAMGWKRQGGIAGLCESITVYASGEVYGINCGMGGDGRTALLTSAERIQLYAWLDQFSNSTLDLSDPKGVSDGMSRLADIAGTGDQRPSGDHQREIYSFGQNLYDRLYP